MPPLSQHSHHLVDQVHVCETSLPDEDDVVLVGDACTNKIHRALANNLLVMLPATNHHLKALPPSAACSAPFLCLRSLLMIYR